MELNEPVRNAQEIIANNQMVDNAMHMIAVTLIKKFNVDNEVAWKAIHKEVKYYIENLEDEDNTSEGTP